MFGTNVEFSGSAGRVDLLPVEPNPRGGRRSSWKISNEYIGLSLECVIRSIIMRAALQEYGRE